MKKTVLSLAVIVVLSASTFTATAQGVTSNAMGGSNPRPQAMGGSNPRPQSAVSVLGSAYAAVLAYFGF